MNGRDPSFRRVAWIAALASLLPAAVAAGDAYDEIVSYDWTKSRSVPASIEAETRQAATAAERRAIEVKLIRALTDAKATFECKQFVCRMLRRTGSAACVPALSALLTDEKLSHQARFALQFLPDPGAAAALRAGLGKTKGKLRLGIVGSLGRRRDAEAVTALARLAAGEDAELTAAAIRALGRIASAKAADALAGMKVDESMKARWADAYLQCADRMLADGNAAGAAGVYRKLFAADQAKTVRIAALRGVVLAEKDKAAGALLKLMSDDDADLRRAAGKFVIEMPGEAATRAFAGALGSMKPDRQVAMLDALSARGDPAAAPSVMRLALSGQEAVRVAAIKALGVVGDAASVEMLAKAAAAGGTTGQAAIDSLNRLKGEGVSEAMAKLLDSPEAAFRAGVLRVLSTRADKTMLPAMLKAARDSDEGVRKAAVAGLTAVAGGKELPGILDLLLTANSGTERLALQRAAGSAAMRVDDVEARTAPIAAALPRADAKAKAMLIDLLGRSGGRRALAAVRAQLGADEADVATEAVRALSAWPDATPAGDLMKIIRTTDNRVHKVLAFRGYIRMANMPATGGASSTQMYKQALRLASSTAEKKSVLGGLAGARSPEALRLVEPLLAEAELKAEAESAYVQIAGNARDAAPDEARAALRKIVAATSNTALRDRAKAILNEMDKYRGYVTSWLVSGPYTKGPPFDTAFAPEKPGRPGAKWAPLSKGVGPQTINLQATFGGDNRAVYAKTSVYSPADRAVRLEMGSDDGIKVWVNGKQVHAKNANRPIRPAEDKADARLKKGWNVLLVKISQNGGDFGFCFRICQPDGAAIEGLRVSVEGR